MLKEHIKGNAYFQYYRDGDLWYMTDSGFKFPVPISDIGNACFNKTEKALLLMRYMRKYIATITPA